MASERVEKRLPRRPASRNIRDEDFPELVTFEDG